MIVSFPVCRLDPQNRVAPPVGDHRLSSVGFPGTSTQLFSTAWFRSETALSEAQAA
jgi:hypothetical protein